MAYAKLQGGDWFRCVETETMSSVRGNTEVPYLKLDQFGGPGTTPCTIARVGQNFMNKVTGRTGGRDRALSFTSVPLVPAPTGVIYDAQGNHRARPVRLAPHPKAKAAPGGKGKGQKGKGKGKVKGMAKAKAKGKGKGKGK